MQCFSAVLYVDITELKTEANQALEPTTLAVTFRAPSRTDRASQGRGSSLTFGKN